MDPRVNAHRKEPSGLSAEAVHEPALDEAAPENLLGGAGDEKQYQRHGERRTFMADIVDGRHLMRRKAEQPSGKRIAERKDRIEERRRNEADEHGPPGPLRPFHRNAREPKREQSQYRGRRAHADPEIDPVQAEIHPPEERGQCQRAAHLPRCRDTRRHANIPLIRPCASSRPRGSSIPAMSSSPKRK